MLNEKILINYDHNQVYNNDPSNIIGANTSETLRTVTSGDDTDTKYVKMFGTDYAIGDITNAVISTPRSDGGGVNQWKYEFYNENGTLLGTVTDASGASSFVDGTAEASTKIYIKIVWISGTVSITNGDDIALTTDVDSPLSVKLSGESFTSGEFLLSLSKSGSTYYMANQTDFSYKYGGARHTPDGTAKLPYFDISSAVAALGGAFTICEVMDSEGYLITSEIDLNTASMILQSSSGKSPKIIRKAGQTEYFNNAGTVLNNSNALFFNENGDAANDGSWLTPKDTPEGAGAAVSGHTYVCYGGFNASESGGIFDGQITTDGAYILTTEYGYKPDLLYTYNYLTSVGAGAVIENYTLVGCYNFRFLTPSRTAIRTGSGAATTLTVYNCTFEGLANHGVQYVGTSNFTLTFEHNYINGLQRVIYTTTNQATNETITAKYNYSVNIDYFFSLGNTLSTLDLTVENNFIFQSTTGISIGAATFTSVNINKNTFVGAASAGNHISAAAGTMTIDNNIFYLSYAAINTPTNQTINNNCFYSQSFKFIGAGTITDNNPVDADPLFCYNTGSVIDWYYGIRPDSPCYRAGSDSDDIGARIRMIEVNESNITINGFDFITSFFTTSVYILDTADHVGLILVWNTFSNFLGNTVDLYDDATALDCAVSTCLFNYCGVGVNFTQGGNSSNNNIFNRPKYAGLFIDGDLTAINNCVFFNGKYGVETADTATGFTITNTIFNLFSLAVKSNVYASIFYNCITDGVSSTIDKSDSSNINNNPLFNDTDIGSEDFNIKTVEAGSFRDSACKDAGSDGGDIGAYTIDRGISQDSWSSYQLEQNPRQIQFQNIMKGLNKFEKIDGGLDLFAKDVKRVFLMKWTSRQYSTQELREKIVYFASRVKTRFNQIVTDEQIKLRLSFLPTQSIKTGTNGDVDVNARTLTDTAAAMTENEYKGYHVGIVYTSGSGMVIDATLKTATDSGEAWIVDQWKGYFLYHNNNFYYILSNTATALTLSDPNNTLSNDTISYTLERYFKIESNTDQRFCLNNDDGDLAAALSADWYIRFIEVIVRKPLIKFTQPRFFYQQETWKNGYQLELEEY